jgi:hypothetical protein
MLAWPVVQQLIEPFKPKIPNFMLTSADQDVRAIVLGVQGTTRTLPNDGVESLNPHQAAPIAGLDLQIPSSSNSLQLPTPSLNWDMMQRLSKAFFDTFNFLYPVMDRESFNANILAAAAGGGFDDGALSALAFLVFALGEVSIAGTQGMPIGIYKGRPSGVKGGTLDRPPGLAFFNEARKRMGYSLTECSLENVQMFALAG